MRKRGRKKKRPRRKKREGERGKEERREGGKEREGEGRKKCRREGGREIEFWRKKMGQLGHKKASTVSPLSLWMPTWIETAQVLG